MKPHIEKPNHHIYYPKHNVQPSKEKLQEMLKGKKMPSEEAELSYELDSDMTQILKLSGR